LLGHAEPCGTAGRARLVTLWHLAQAAEEQDAGRQEHAVRVARTARTVAEQLGLGKADADLLYRAAPLHDVGKLAVPREILLKPGRLTETEFERIKDHTTIGALLLADDSSEVLRIAAEIALTHHEWWNGHGYPAGLAGEDIPLSGRVVALADVFDALTHDRPYKSAWPVDQAVAEITGLAGRQFDPRVVEAFMCLDAQALANDAPTPEHVTVTAELTLAAEPVGQLWA
jgi:putative two-component system response regulator